MKHTIKDWFYSLNEEIFFYTKVVYSTYMIRSISVGEYSTSISGVKLQTNLTHRGVLYERTCTDGSGYAAGFL